MKQFFSAVGKWIDDLFFATDDEELLQLMEWARKQDHKTRMQLLHEMRSDWNEHIKQALRKLLRR